MALFNIPSSIFFVQMFTLKYSFLRGEKNDHGQTERTVYCIESHALLTIIIDILPPQMDFGHFYDCHLCCSFWPKTESWIDRIRFVMLTAVTTHWWRHHYNHHDRHRYLWRHHLKPKDLCILLLLTATHFLQLQKKKRGKSDIRNKEGFFFTSTSWS